MVGQTQVRGRDAVADSTEQRLLDAALVCVARVGHAKTTLDDVAREAGCSRAMLYRYFPGKRPLTRALVTREIATLAGELERATSDATTLSDAVVATITTAARAVQQHAALQYVLAVESEIVLPYLTFENADRFLAIASQVAAPSYARFLADADTRRLGEWVVRIALSYLCSPSDTVDLADEVHVRTLVDSFVIPGFVGAGRQSDHQHSAPQGVVR